MLFNLPVQELLSVCNASQWLLTPYAVLSTFYAYSISSNLYFYSTSETHNSKYFTALIIPKRDIVINIKEILGMINISNQQHLSIKVANESYCHESFIKSVP